MSSREPVSKKLVDRFRRQQARFNAVAALTKIFLAEIERPLLAAAGVAEAANTPRASRPRLGGVSPATASGRPSTTTCTSTRG